MGNVTISDQKASLHPIFDHFLCFFRACKFFAIGMGGRVQSEAGWGVPLGGRGGIALPPESFQTMVLDFFLKRPSQMAKYYPLGT